MRREIKKLCRVIVRVSKVVKEEEEVETSKEVVASVRHSTTKNGRRRANCRGFVPWDERFFGSRLRSRETYIKVFGSSHDLKSWLDYLTAKLGTNIES